MIRARCRKQEALIKKAEEKSEIKKGYQAQKERDEEQGEFVLERDALKRTFCRSRFPTPTASFHFFFAVS